MQQYRQGCAAHNSTVPSNPQAQGAQAPPCCCAHLAGKERCQELVRVAWVEPTKPVALESAPLPHVHNDVASILQRAQGGRSGCRWEGGRIA